MIKCRLYLCWVKFWTFLLNSWQEMYLMLKCYEVFMILFLVLSEGERRPGPNVIKPLKDLIYTCS
jgi:hypothetical protein